MTIKVVDDFGKVVPGVPVRISTYARTVRGEAFGKDTYRDIIAKTDSNGLAVLNGESQLRRIGVGIPPVEGFYYTRGGDYAFSEAINGKWQPWNPTVELVLKPVLNPLPVYFSVVETHIKKPNQKFGFDLMVEDWVPPEGGGRIADLEFEIRGYWRDSTDHDCALIVSFPNPLDGIQEFKLPRPGTGSDLLSPRYAPLEGYVRELRLHDVRMDSDKAWVDDKLKEHGYFLRIRSVVDDHGRLKSATYGKIHHGFYFGGAVTNCPLKIRALYLSPESNSQNMEFDQKRILPKPGKR